MARELTESSSISQEHLNTALARHKGEIERLHEELKTADAAEKAELKQRIETLEKQIEADRKAREEKEKAEGAGGTLVLPPGQTPQSQHHGDTKPGDEPAGPQSVPDGSPKRGRWKKAW